MLSVVKLSGTFFIAIVISSCWVFHFFTILLTVVAVSHFFSFFECFNAITFFIVKLSVVFLLLWWLLLCWVPPFSLFHWVFSHFFYQCWAFAFLEIVVMLSDTFFWCAECWAFTFMVIITMLSVTFFCCTFLLLCQMYWCHRLTPKVQNLAESWWITSDPTKDSNFRFPLAACSRNGEVVGKVLQKWIIQWKTDEARERNYLINKPPKT